MSMLCFKSHNVFRERDRLSGGLEKKTSSEKATDLENRSAPLEFEFDCSHLSDKKKSKPHQTDCPDLLLAISIDGYYCYCNLKNIRNGHSPKLAQPNRMLMASKNLDFHLQKKYTHMAINLGPWLSSPAHSLPLPSLKSTARASQFRFWATKMSAENMSSTKVIDSHLHVWASPDEAIGKYPYSPGQEPTLPGHVEFLLECMENAGVDGALIVQPINHKFDHSYVSSVLDKYPSKFVGCCLANPAEDGSGIHQLESLVLKDGFCAVRFNPYLWPDGQLMTNEIGRKLFAKAGELGVPVGFMCMKGLNQHISEIENLCSDFPCTTVLLDHLAFCKSPKSDEESAAFSNLLKLSKFPQVHVKFSALFRVSTEPFPYHDLSTMLSQLISKFGANRVMWGSDFPFVVPECGYKEAKEAVSLIAERVLLSSTELEYIMGGTISQLFRGRWHSS